MDKAHQLGVGEVFHACGSVDALNPESTEVAFFIFTVAVGVGETFFPGVLGYGPYVSGFSYDEHAKLRGLLILAFLFDFLIVSGLDIGGALYATHSVNEINELESEVG